MIALGIDVGTTQTKVLALDCDTATVLAVASEPTPVGRDADGEARSAPAVLGVVLSLLERVAHGLDDAALVRALCVASVGEEVVLLDGDHRVIGETITWYDPRGRDQADAFLAGPSGERGVSGRWPPDPTFSLFKLLWLREHRPAEYGRAATWTDLGDYVLAGLGAEVAMDWSHASRAGAFDLVARAWDPAVLEAAGLDIDFPRLVASGSIVGRLGPAVAARAGLPGDVALVAGGHDHLCAAFGAGIRGGAELFLSAGTSEAHLALLDAPLDGAAARAVDQGCYVDADHYYAHVNVHSGQFYRQWRDLLFRGVDAEALEAALAATEPGAGGIVFEPTADARRAHLAAVPYDAGGADLMRAVLEGLARHSAAIVETLEQVRGRPFEQIVVAGVPTRSRLWRDLRRSAYGRPLAAVDVPEPTAYGAASMAALATGLADGERLTARRVAW